MRIKRDRCGSLPVHIAASNTDSRVLDSILFDYAYYDINAPRHNQETALHISSSLGITSNVKLLLKKRIIDVNMQDMQGNTPLHNACKGGYLETILALKSDPCCRLQFKQSFWKNSGRPDAV